MKIRKLGGIRFKIIWEEIRYVKKRGEVVSVSSGFKKGGGFESKNVLVSGCFIP